MEAFHGSAGSEGGPMPARFLESATESCRALTESLEQGLGRKYRHTPTSTAARYIVEERQGFGQRTGEQSSAKRLAMSYAALVSGVTARRAVVSQ
jgi:hypothetical protein